LGRQLVAKGLGGARVRIGWEMNSLPGPAAKWGADWSAGNSRDGEREFVLAFRRMVDAMRRAPGQSFRFVWCPSIGSSWSPALGREIDTERCYPGDRYVSVIACDVYDRSWSHNTNSASRWADLRTDRFGNRASLDWFARFVARGYRRQNNDGSARVGPGHAAAGQARPLGIAEFGTWRGPDERPGQRDGGDDPAFLDRLMGWVAEVGPERFDHLNYWNFGQGGRLTPTPAYPRWDARLRDLFGQPPARSTRRRRARRARNR
jgi:hypothetical protein